MTYISRKYLLSTNDPQKMSLSLFLSISLSPSFSLFSLSLSLLNLLGTAVLIFHISWFSLQLISSYQIVHTVGYHFPTQHQCFVTYMTPYRTSHKIHYISLSEISANSDLLAPDWHHNDSHHIDIYHVSTFFMIFRRSNTWYIVISLLSSCLVLILTSSKNVSDVHFQCIFMIVVLIFDKI